MQHRMYCDIGRQLVDIDESVASIDIFTNDSAVDYDVEPDESYNECNSEFSPDKDLHLLILPHLVY